MTRSRLEAAVDSLGPPRGSRILIAVSGGPDSVALLEALHRMRNLGRHDWELRVGHVNHGLRGAEADEDEAFVRGLAQDRGLEVDVSRAEIHAGGSGEARAREARYAALRAMLQAWPGDFLALGHTLDDQAETLVMRLLRGTGLLGLVGMRPRSGTLIRPFLSIRRIDILEALKEYEVDYRVDSSNLEPNHFRNRLRQDVMPILEAAHPGSIEGLGRAAEILSTDADFLAVETERALQVMLRGQEGSAEIEASVPIWLSLHPALQRSTLRAMIERLEGNLFDIDAATIQRATAVIKGGGRLALPHGRILEATSGRFRLSPITVVAESWEPVHLEVPGEANMPAGRLRAEILEVEPEEIERLLEVCGPLVALVDADVLGTRLQARRWKPGDRMRPLGAPGSRKLQDIFVDRKIELSLRNQLPVVENGRHIVWIPGVALDQRVAIIARSTRVARLLFEPKIPEYRDKLWR